MLSSVGLRERQVEASTSKKATAPAPPTRSVVLDPISQMLQWIAGESIHLLLYPRGFNKMWLRRYAHPSTEHRVANFPNEQRPPERVTGNLGRSRPVGSYTGDIVDRSRPFQPFAAQAQNINHGFGPFKLHSQDPQSSTPPKRPTPLLDYFSSSRSDAALMTNDDAHFPRTKVMSKTHIYRDSNGETSTTYNDRQIDKRNLSTVSTIEDSEPKRLRSKPYSAPVTDGIVGFDTETPVITEQPSSTSAHAQSTQRPKSQSRSCAPCRKAKVGCDKKEPCNSCRRKGRQNGEYRLTARCCLRRHAFQQPKAKEDVACIYPNAVGTGKTSARKTNPHDSPDPSNATMDSGSGSSYRDREGDLERRNRTKPENTSSRRKTRSALAAGKDATSKLPPSVEGTVNNIWDSNAGGQLPSDLDITTNHSLPIAIPSSSPSRPVSEDRESEAVAHFIVVVTDRRVQKRWLTGSLTGGTLPRLLQEISAYTPGRPILKIMCTLSTSHEGLDDVEYEIKKDDGRMFSEMVREFRSRIAEGERKRITHFRILWEPVFGEQTSI